MYAPPAMPAISMESGLRPAVDAKKPVTHIRVTLHNGQQTTLELNTSHTVADIHSFVMSLVPDVGSYQLMSGYPPRPLADPSMTIEKAKLKQANVSMRLI